MQADLGDAVTIEVASEWIVPRVAEHERELRCAEPTLVLAELVDDVEPLLGRTVDR